MERDTVASGSGRSISERQYSYCVIREGERRAYPELEVFRGWGYYLDLLGCGRVMHSLGPWGGK